MRSEPRLLDDELLGQLEGRWRKLGAFVARASRPGLTDDQIDALTLGAGLSLPEEARRWWRWHDGADPQVPGVAAELGPGRAFLPLADAVTECRELRELMQDVSVSTDTPDWKRRGCPSTLISDRFCWTAAWLTATPFEYGRTSWRTRLRERPGSGRSGAEPSCGSRRWIVARGHTMGMATTGTTTGPSYRLTWLRFTSPEIGHANSGQAVMRQPPAPAIRPGSPASLSAGSDYERRLPLVDRCGRDSDPRVPR